MSQEKLQTPDDDEEDEGLLKNPLRLYAPNLVDEAKAQQKLSQFFNPLPIECLGLREDPIDKSNIEKKKKDLNIPYVDDFKREGQTQNLSVNDGVFQTSELEKQDTMNLHRQEKRLARDSRQEYYKQNGQLIVDREFFDEKVSRLANISFEGNPAIATFQKNAILSLRTNQNKTEPYDFEIFIGQVHFRQHPLMNDEQKKFQTIRPTLERLQRYATHPQLPYLSKLIKQLIKKKEKAKQQGARTEVVNEIEQQISKAESSVEKQREQIEGEMRKVLEVWNEIKAIQRSSGCTTVPWKISVKEYTVAGQKQYELGLSNSPVTQSNLPKDTDIRKSEMEKEVYFMRLQVNGNIVSKTGKIRMTWPNFTLSVYQKFSMYVYTMPFSIRLEIVKDGLIETVVDRIDLKLPGQHAQTLTSTERRLVSESFYQNGQAVRRRKQQPEGIVGMVEYRAEWKGEGSTMPPSSISFTDSVQSLASTEVPDDMSEKLLNDPNDPRKSGRSTKQLKKKTVAAVDRVSREALLPFDNVISTRQFLLKLRAKNNNLSGKKIPLTEQAIRKRQDLMQILDQERQANNLNLERPDDQVYNPLQGHFKYQQQQVKQRIKQIVNKFINNRHITSTGVASTSYKYRLVDQIINEYTFEQMVSPIVVFFKDLFTQKRKLGPRKTHTAPTRQNITQLHIQLHVSSGIAVPVRESSNNVLVRIRNTRQTLVRQVSETIGLISGLSLFQQQPNINNPNFGYYNNAAGGMNYGNRMGYGPGMVNRPQSLQVDYNPHRSEEAHDVLSKVQRVTTFVQILYKKNSRRTGQAEGVSPEWNETISLPYNMRYEQSSLEHMFFSTGKKVHINLFDIYEESRPTQAVSEINIQKSKFYLGGMEVPLSTLISLPKATGSFKIRRPIVLFGYTSLSPSLLSTQNQENEFKTENPLQATYLNMDLSVTPTVDNSVAYNSDRKFFSGQEDPLFLQHANDWLEQMNLRRYIRLWLTNLEGNSTFISRFIVDVEIPPFRNERNPESTIERAARFVSLIPHKPFCKLMDNTEQFHMTCQQFLDAKMGDDHAFLLCNYFNAIDRMDSRGDMESYVVIGKAFPQGKTMYVLRIDKKTLDFELWNPRTGECYCFDKETFETVCCCFTVGNGLKTNKSAKDICPLLEVGCIVSKDNVYVNIQVSADPGQIYYDLTNEKHWKPFLTERSKRQLFDRKPLKPYQTIPITRAFYEQNRNSREKEIEDDLLHEIKTQLETDRRNLNRPYTFRIEKNISDMARNDLLFKLQSLVSDFRLTGNESKFYWQRQKDRNNWQSALQQIESSKARIKQQIDSEEKIYGFTLNFPFTTIQQALQRIKMTQFHLIEKEDIKFVVSVRTFQYPCFITSVWLFLGVIE